MLTHNRPPQHRHARFHSVCSLGNLGQAVSYLTSKPISSNWTTSRGSTDAFRARPESCLRRHRMKGWCKDGAWLRFCLRRLCFCNAQAPGRLLSKAALSKASGSQVFSRETPECEQACVPQLLSWARAAWFDNNFLQAKDIQALGGSTSQ